MLHAFKALLVGDIARGFGGTRKRAPLFRPQRQVSIRRGLRICCDRHTGKILPSLLPCIPAQNSKAYSREICSIR